MRAALVALWQTAIAGTLWGTSFPVISQALKGGLDPEVFVFLRFALATPIMLGVAVALKKDMAKILKSKPVWIIAFLNAVGFLCQFIGQQYTEASVAALLVNLSVVLAAVGSALFLGEKMNVAKASGVVLAFGGTALIATNGNFNSLPSGQILGDSLYLVSAVSWAAYIVYAKKKTDEMAWDPIGVATGIVALTAFLMLPVATLGRGWSDISTTSWEAIAYVAILNTAVAFIFYQAGLRHLTATASAVVLMLEILVALVISVGFLGETLTAYAIVGAVAVLVSIMLVSGLEVRGKSLSVSESGGRPVQVFD